MKLDSQSRTLVFDSQEELEALHDELTVMLREITIAAASSSPDAEVATARAGQVLDRFAAVTSALNAIRESGMVRRRPG